MKTLSWIIATLALIASGAYLFVYVYRWEWHRALLVGILFLATLVGLCAALVLRRLGSVEARLRGMPGGPSSPHALERLRAAPVENRPFPWLRPEALDRTSIFIPVLLGGGFVVSGLAWLVERVAGRAARSGVEEQLARDLEGIGFPAAALVPTDAELLAGGEDFRHDPAVRLLLGPAATGGPR